ncbi:uncharacterized protein LOC108028348 isoform X2 [Drosophila biarmipes]|uniref:uncharacterized protein LOC108028348 isoform X2 n=1 Tax=Drosophila biarmipes TaxID=125945 RepID=UPI0007E7C9D7|nr:uncharacterized protein LOC108028348 isoform X2 [Drosophila biarmipes]
MIAEFPRSTTNVNCDNRKSRESQEAEKSPNESRKDVKSISCDVGRGRKFGQKKRSKQQQQQNGEEEEGGEEEQKEEEQRQPLQQQVKENKKLCEKQEVKDKRKKQRGEKDKKKQRQQQRANKKKKQQQPPPVHSKKSLVLFLDHSRECPASEIVAAASADRCDVRGAGCNHANSKYAANYGTSSHFEHKTEIYALYRHLEIGGPLKQVQQQQQLKVGPIHIRLRFEMLFAEPPPPPSQGHAPTAHDNALPDAPPSGEPVIPMLQDQQSGDLMAGTTATNVELMEAIKKLDADLVALFATAATGEPLKMKQQQQVLWTESEAEQIAQDSEDELVITPELFRSCNALQLHLEALTLQPEGTQRMELVQNEVRPIFTVECQLSGDLIRKVPRYPMFHIMQFESEKFQSLTQCTRFGQTAQRQVDMEDKSLEDEAQSAGHVDITVWWREPGTCLNEMLGMGRLELRELYKASLLEQCKCIAIKRRDVHLGSVYVKISLLQNLNGNPEQQPQQQQQKEQPGQKNESGNKAAVKCNSKAVLTPPQPPPQPPPPPQANNNNRAILECVNFMAETNKVRLLRGYLYAGELRQLTAENKGACQELSLQPFWQPQPLLVKIGDGGAFGLQEQFAIINDERFLQSVERQQLVLEVRPLGGVVRLPLHQFFIAYRDASITNHLCKGKLPVISIDGWAPIVAPDTQSSVGELKVLLAIGSESQIAQLKQQRGFDQDNNQVPAPSSTTDLLDMLQNAIAAPTPSIPTPVMPPPPAPPAPSNFSFQLRIVGAAGLPLNPGYGKSKKQVKRQSAAKRFPPNEPPNTYVTFQAINCNSQTYKSHEGLVYATPVVARSTKPQWLSKFRVEVSRDYRSNPQKLFILKLWKKAIVSPNGSGEPSPHEDAIIGFAALNLNQKQPGGGFPSGWHNIVDFNGRVTGGIEAHVEPIPPSMDIVIDQFEKSMELGHLQLGQAIKRKYTELEEISQRLRSRLVDVTGETLKFPEFDVDSALDSWQQDGDDDDLAEDFERALRTPTPPDSPTPSTSQAAQNLKNSNGQE